MNTLNIRTLQHYYYIRTTGIESVSQNTSITRHTHHPKCYTNPETP